VLLVELHRVPDGADDLLWAGEDDSRKTEVELALV
jgi:hypothetical protein